MFHLIKTKIYTQERYVGLWVYACVLMSTFWLVKMPMQRKNNAAETVLYIHVPALIATKNA